MQDSQEPFVGIFATLLVTAPIEVGFLAQHEGGIRLFGTNYFGVERFPLQRGDFEHSLDFPGEVFSAPGPQFVEDHMERHRMRLRQTA